MNNTKMTRERKEQFLFNNGVWTGLRKVFLLARNNNGVVTADQLDSLFLEQLDIQVKQVKEIKTFGTKNYEFLLERVEVSLRRLYEFCTENYLDMDSTVYHDIQAVTAHLNLLKQSLRDDLRRRKETANV